MPQAVYDTRTVSYHSYDTVNGSRKLQYICTVHLYSIVLTIAANILDHVHVQARPTRPSPCHGTRHGSQYVHALPCVYLLISSL